jgi:hypothetical protein
VAGLCARPAAAGRAARALLSSGLTRRAPSGPRQLGKLDLTEVEGLADLLAAETAAQQRQARAQPRAAHQRLLRLAAACTQACTRVHVRGGRMCPYRQRGSTPGWWCSSARAESHRHGTRCTLQRKRTQAGGCLAAHCAHQRARLKEKFR